MMAPVHWALFLNLPSLALRKDLPWLYITEDFNDVFPYTNFHRNVTVPMWDTDLLPNPGPSQIEETFDTMRKASFIAYDTSFSKVPGSFMTVMIQVEYGFYTMQN
jgi:hypothetical protein